jgi:hypothetical protein
VSLMPAVAPRTGPVGARTGAGAVAGNGGYRGGYNGGNAPPPVAVPPSEEAIETLMVRSDAYLVESIASLVTSLFGLKASSLTRQDDFEYRMPPTFHSVDTYCTYLLSLSLYSTTRL